MRVFPTKKRGLTHLGCIFVLIISIYSVIALWMIRITGDSSSLQPDNLSSSQTNGNGNIKQKPKFILHVGPRKTGTTTIQRALFSQSGDGIGKYAHSQLKLDKYKMVHTTWNDGREIVHYLNGLSKGETYKEGSTKFHEIAQQLKDELASTGRNVVLSNEALPSLYPTEETKAALLSLTQGFDVTVSMVYRPLEVLCKSLYNEERRVNTKGKDFDGLDVGVYKHEFGEICQEGFPTYYKKIGTKPEFGDPLTTYETFAYFFGDDKIVVHDLYHPDKIDVVQQFICDAMKAEFSCRYAKENGPPARQNDGIVKEKFKFDEDLVVFAAQRRGVFRYQDEHPKCRIALRRKDTALFLKEQLAFKGKDVSVFRKLCLKDEDLTKFRDRAFHSEQKLSSFPRPKEKFSKDFEELESAGQFCSIDVDLALKNQTILDIIRDERICMKTVYRSLETKNQ